MSEDLFKFADSYEFWREVELRRMFDHLPYTDQYIKVKLGKWSE